jgi:hypothetical protein
VTSIVALPYLQARRERVMAGEWLGPDGLPIASVPDWDYATPVRATRAVAVDLGGVRSDCRLGDAGRLSIAVIWRSTRTSARGAGPVVAIPGAGGAWSGELSLELDGAELGGELRLITRLLLSGSSRPGSPLVPHLAGSVLWEDRHFVLLEGGGARFPMEAIDFDAARLPAAGASWYLHWPREDLHEPLLGALRLYVNDAHPTIQALLSGELSDGVTAGVISMMRYDTVRSMISAALFDDDFVEDPQQYGDGSVGGLLRRMVNGYWPDQTVASLRNHLLSRPESFECELQDRMRLLWVST